MSYDDLIAYFKASVRTGRGHLKKVWFEGKDWANVFLLERYVDGEEYSVEGICSADDMIIAGIVQKQGMVITNGIRSEGVNFAPIKESSRQDAIVGLAKSAVVNMSLSGTAFHIEMRWDHSANRPRIIEINPRLPGGLLCNIHKDRHGINLAKLFIDTSLGINVGTNSGKQDARFYGDLPIPTATAGVYGGIKLSQKFESERNKFGEIDIIDFLPHGEILDPSHSEVYFAHAYIKSNSESKFWEAVRLCDEVSPDLG